MSECDCEFPEAPEWPNGLDAQRDRWIRPVTITLDNRVMDRDVLAASMSDGWVVVARRGADGKPVFHNDHFATDVEHGQVTVTRG